MVFIDLRNVLESSAEALGSDTCNVDFCEMVSGLVGDRDLCAAYVYDTKMPYGVDDHMIRLHDRLRYLGFRVVARESYDPVRKEQKEVDVAMACDMVYHAISGHFDTAVVISGDRDFVPAIECMQGAGKRVESAAFKCSASSAVRRAADIFTELDPLPISIQPQKGMGCDGTPAALLVRGIIKPSISALRIPSRSLRECPC